MGHSGFFRGFGRGTRGATLVEYIVIAGCVALAAIVGYEKFGTSLYSKSRTFGDNVRDLSPTKGGSDYCFVAGTLVATSDGLKPIESLHVGDALLSRDDGGGAIVLSKAVQTFITPNAPLVEVTFREAEAIRVTPGHPFFTLDRHWIDAQALAPGEELATAEGAPLHVDHVTRLAERATVYNVEVEDTHTYFVGSARAWVHNPNDCNGNPIVEPPPGGGPECTSGNCAGGTTCFVAGTPIATLEGPKPVERVRAGDWVLSKSSESGEMVIEPVTATFITRDREVVAIRVIDRANPVIATPSHPFFTRDRGWVPARDLRHGEPLEDATGATLEVDSVTPRVEHADVYNFEVAETHTYFAGDWFAWVHNPDPDPAAATQSLHDAPGISADGKTYIDENGLQYSRVGGQNGQILYLSKPHGQGDGEYYYRAMSRAEYEQLKANGGKIPVNPDPHAFGGIAPDHGYVTNPKKPYFNNNNGDVVVEFNAPGAAQGFADAQITGKTETGVTSFGLGDQGSKPLGWKPPKKPKKGKPAPPVDRPTLDTFNDHLQSWQVVDAKIPTPPGWKPPSANCN